jgi:membrane-associated phospholipid phosphatase
VLAQIDNQYAFWGQVLPLQSGRMPRTLELVELVVQFCVFVESRFKHELNCRRPAEHSAQVQPMITTPGHGSLPSGHCTQSYAVAHVLARLLGITPPGAMSDPRDVQLQRLAARISTNRVVAGMHFPVDNLAGRLLGFTLGEYAMARFDPSTSTWNARRFDGALVPPAEAFDPVRQPLDLAPPPYYGPFVASGARQFRPPSPILEWMWQRASAECAHLR